MKNIIVFLIFCTSVYSQKSGIAYYSIQLPEYKDKNGQEDNMLNEAKKIAENRILVLEFNDIQSHFYLKNDMKNEDGSELASCVASILSGTENYYDTTKQSSVNKQVDGVLLQDSNAIKSWKITTETKMIDNYLCYKAEYIKKYKSYTGEKSKLITAWFAPSLPFPFGPNSYNGLPGLVVELIESGKKEKKYFLRNIELKDQRIEIRFPKGKIITEEDYLKNVDYYSPKQ